MSCLPLGTACLGSSTPTRAKHFSKPPLLDSLESHTLVLATPLGGKGNKKHPLGTCLENLLSLTPSCFPPLTFRFAPDTTDKVEKAPQERSPPYVHVLEKGRVHHFRTKTSTRKQETDGEASRDSAAGQLVNHSRSISQIQIKYKQIPVMASPACDVGADARLPNWTTLDRETQASSCLRDHSVLDHSDLQLVVCWTAWSVGLEAGIADARLHDLSVFQLSEHSRLVPATDDRHRQAQMQVHRSAHVATLTFFCSATSRVTRLFRWGCQSGSEGVSALTCFASHFRSDPTQSWFRPLLRAHVKPVGPDFGSESPTCHPGPVHSTQRAKPLTVHSDDDGEPSRHAPSPRHVRFT